MVNVFCDVSLDESSSNRFQRRSCLVETDWNSISSRFVSAGSKIAESLILCALFACLANTHDKTPPDVTSVFGSFNSLLTLRDVGAANSSKRPLYYKERFLNVNLFLLLFS